MKKHYSDTKICYLFICQCALNFREEEIYLIHNKICYKSIAKNLKKIEAISLHQAVKKGFRRHPYSLLGLNGYRAHLKYVLSLCVECTTHILSLA